MLQTTEQEVDRRLPCLAVMEHCVKSVKILDSDRVDQLAHHVILSDTFDDKSTIFDHKLETLTTLVL